jgi:hypothetical protein
MHPTRALVVLIPLTMSNKPTRTAAPYQRRTLAIRGTVSRQEAQLNHASALATAYAREWMRSGPAATGADPLASGVLRRALAVYMAHLNHRDTDPQAEARAVRSCCSTLTADPEDRSAAFKRLEAAAPGHSFPSFPDVLNGPQQANKWADLEDRADALVTQMYRERFKPKGTA